MAKNEKGNIAAAPVRKEVKNEEKETGEVREYERETRNFPFFGNNDKNEAAKENNTHINIEETEKENATCGGDEEVNILSGFEAPDATIQALIDHFRPFPRFVSWILRKKSFVVSHLNDCHQRTTCTFPLAKYGDVKKAFESAVEFNNEVNKERLSCRNERFRQKEDIRIEDVVGTLRRTVKEERKFSVNVKDGKKMYNEEESDGSQNEDHHHRADSRECRDKETKSVETTERHEEEDYDERVFEPSTPTTPTTTESIEPLIDETISSTSSFSKTTLTSLCHQTHQRINYADITTCPLSGGGDRGGGDSGGDSGPVQSKSSFFLTSSSSSVDVMPTTTTISTTVLSSSSSSFLSEETAGGDEQLLIRNLEDSGGKENQSGNLVVSSFPCEMTTIASTLKPQLPGVRWVAAPYFWWEVNRLAGGGDRRRFPVKRFGGNVREAFEAANQFALHRQNRVAETRTTTTNTTTTSTDNEWMAASTTTAAAALMTTLPCEAVVAAEEADRGEGAVATNHRNSSSHVVEDDDDISLRCCEAEPTNSNSSSNSKGRKTKISEELSPPTNLENSLDSQCLTMHRKVRKSTRLQKEETTKKKLSRTDPPVTPAAFLFSPSPLHSSLDSFGSTSCRTTTVCATRESSKAFQQAAANALHPWRNEVRWEASRSRWRVRYTRPLVLPLVVVSENGGRRGGDKQLEKSEEEGGEDGGRERGGGQEEEMIKVKYNNGKEMGNRKGKQQLEVTEDKPKTFLKYFSLSRYNSVEEAYEKAVAFVKQMKRLNHRANYLANEEEALLRSSSSSSSPTTSIIKTAAVITNATSESIVPTDSHTRFTSTETYVDVNKMSIKNTEKEEDDESRSGRLTTTDDNLSLAQPPPLSPTSAVSSFLQPPACTAVTTTILSSSTSTTMALSNFNSIAAAAVFPRKRSSSSTLFPPIIKPGVCGGAVVPTLSGDSRTGNSSSNSTISSNSTSSTFPTPTMTTVTVNSQSSTKATANGHCGVGGGGGDLPPISRMIELCGGGEKSLSLDNSGDDRTRSPNTTIANNIQQQQQLPTILLLPTPNISPKTNEAVQSQTKEATIITSPSELLTSAAAVEIKKSMEYDVNEGDGDDVITGHREDIKISHSYNDGDMNGVDNDEGDDGEYKSDDGEEEEEGEDWRSHEKSSRRPERKSAAKAKREQHLLLASMQDEEEDESQEEGGEDSSVSSFSSFSSSSKQSDDDDFPISSNSSTLCPTYPDYYSSSALPPPRTTSSTVLSSSVSYHLPAAASPPLSEEEYAPMHEFRHLKRLKISKGKAKTTEEKEEKIEEDEEEEEKEELEEDQQRVQQIKYKGGGEAASSEMQNSNSKRIKKFMDIHHRDYETIDGSRNLSSSSTCSATSSCSSTSSTSSSTRGSSGSTTSATANNYSFSANSSTIIPTTRCSSSSIGSSAVSRENEETRGANVSKGLQELENLILNISRMNREALDAKMHPPFSNPL